MATTTVASEVLEKLFRSELERYELVNGELLAKPMVSIPCTSWKHALTLRPISNRPPVR